VGVRARRGNDVFLSVIETGEKVPPLLDTRWQLWVRSAAGWRLLQHEQEYRQREPCTIAPLTYRPSATLSSLSRPGGR